MRYDAITLLASADPQPAGSYPDDPDWWIVGSKPGSTPEEYRRYSVGVRNIGRAVDKAIEVNADLFFQPGDNIDFNTPIGEEATVMGLVEDEISRLTMPGLYGVGNHETGLFTGNGGRLTPADFYTLTPSQATMSGTLTDADGWKSYWYDIKGVRIVMLNTLDNSRTVTALEHEAWLVTALDTSMPCIVITHYPLFDTDLSSWTFIQNHEALRAIIDAAGNVQCAIGGHYHNNALDRVINNIPYISLFGQVLCPNEDDSAYYLFEIASNAVSTANGLKPNIKITGYGSNGVAKTKDFTQYAIF